MRTAIVVERTGALGALLVIDASTVGGWAAANDVAYTTYQR
jgi:hypothetical protein